MSTYRGLREADLSGMIPQRVKNRGARMYAAQSTADMCCLAAAAAEGIYLINVGRVARDLGRSGRSRGAVGGF